MTVQEEVRSNGQKPPIKRWILWAFVSCGLLLGAWAAYRFVPVFFQRDSESIVITSDWVTHQDPKGFTISHPKEWKVLANSPSGRVKLVGGRNLRVTVWPLFIAAELTGSSASDVLARLTARALRNVQWDPPEMMTQVISEAFQYRGQTDLELGRRWENAVLGMEDMVDPLTGQQIKLESGSDYLIDGWVKAGVKRRALPMYARQWISKSW
jgi:hypothetical protein